MGFFITDLYLPIIFSRQLKDCADTLQTTKFGISDLKNEMSKFTF